VGDVALSYDAQAVIRSIRNILLTRHYEKLFNPNFGSGIDIILFENISSVSSAALEKEIQTLIENYEKRATMKEIRVSPGPDNNSYSVSLTFYIENSTLPTTVTLLLERNR
jgi:phage baseplate assembly protein W